MNFLAHFKLVPEVIYYIDYPGNVLYTLPQTKERPPGAITLKMIREAIIREADDCPKERTRADYLRVGIIA